MLNPVKNGKQLSVDASGNLLVTGSFSVSGGNASASTTGAAVPAQADYVGFNSSGNLVGVSSLNPLPVIVGNPSATDSGNALYVNQEGVKATYSASVSGSPTIISGVNFALQGSNSKKIKITRFNFGCTATAASSSQIVLFVTTLSGGTPAAPGFTTGPYDPNDAAPTATPIFYSVAPTISTQQSQAVNMLYPFINGATTSPNEFIFGNHPAKCPTLRDNSHYFCFYVATAPGGGKINFLVEWTEE